MKKHTTTLGTQQASTQSDDMIIPRPEYPRPQFVRADWMCLNGTWKFAFDRNNQGLREGWYLPEKSDFDGEIVVPFVYTSEKSGVNQRELVDVVWYSRTICIDADAPNYMLHFGAVDYVADVWINGSHAGSHRGGHTSFSFEIGHLLHTGENCIVLRAEDRNHDFSLPRGKQYWKVNSESIFYTHSTGIWQTVWLEPLSDIYIRKQRITSDFDGKTVALELDFAGWTAAKANQDLQLEIGLYLGDTRMASDRIQMLTSKIQRRIWLDQSLPLEWADSESYAWSPENPVLFDITYTIYRDNHVVDRVESYFGFRKISIEDGRFMLNDRPYFQRLLLDQGYWRESLLTAPDDAAFVRDIEICKAMGFNGVRKHQKIEDPRFLYWADKLGLLVWAEAANAYVYSTDYVKEFVPEWISAIERDYNHPSIVAWTPLNESWGVDRIASRVEQQCHAASMYWLTRSLDSTRPVISNDGWEHAETDLVTIHDYEWRQSVLEKRYGSLESALNERPAGRNICLPDWPYKGQPIVISEFGGISFKIDADSGWGYSTAEDALDFISRYKAVVQPLIESPVVNGFCYTQLCDVEQEINGLLSYDRIPKVPVEQIRAITLGISEEEQ